MPTETDPNAKEKSSLGLRIFTAILVAALIVFFILLQRSDRHHGSIGGDAYHALVNGVREHEGYEPNDIALQQDAGIHDPRGDQYSGQITIPNGQTAPITVWMQESVTSHGRGFSLEYRISKAGSTTAPIITLPYVETHTNE